MSAGLLAQLGAAALVELTAFVAVANMASRTNTAFGVESQGSRRRALAPARPTLAA